MATFHGYGFQFPPFMGPVQILRKKPFLHRVEIDEFDLRSPWLPVPPPQMNNQTLPLPPIALEFLSFKHRPQDLRACIPWLKHGKFMEDSWRIMDDHGI